LFEIGSAEDLTSSSSEITIAGSSETDDSGVGGDVVGSGVGGFGGVEPDLGVGTLNLTVA
jgi:hypothetical protein